MGDQGILYDIGFAIGYPIGLLLGLILRILLFPVMILEGLFEM